jgi:hypothetical protein
MGRALAVMQWFVKTRTMAEMNENNVDFLKDLQEELWPLYSGS